MLALMVVPSIVPEAEDARELSKLNVKFLPDCETVKPASRTARDFPQGNAAKLFSTV